MKTIAKITTALLISLPFISTSQNDSYDEAKKDIDLGVRIERQTTGSGHLNFTSMGADIGIGRSSLFVGALLEDRNRSFKGLKANFRHFPLSFGSSIRPYFQYSFISRWNSRLVPELERIMHADVNPNTPMERYHTMEHYLGFGFQGDIWDGAFLDLGVGLGAYHSEMTSDFDSRREAERFRSSFDASLSLSAGIGYRF